MTSVVKSPELPEPIGPFSPGLDVDGTVYLSGQVGVSPRTKTLVPGGVPAETEQVLENLRVLLASVGKGFSDVVSVRVFLTSMKDFQLMNAVYARYFRDPYPARTTVGVTELPMGASVEIDLVAVGRKA
jgi:2-iminobutanoate/2-iminopropanoate deaminase